MSRNSLGAKSSGFDAVVRTALRVAFPVLRLWWRLRRPAHQGTQVAIWFGDSLLLARSSYRSEWSLPGGGIKKGEDPEAAARREVAEEIGLTKIELISKGTAKGLWDGRLDHVWFFEASFDQLPSLRPDNREIIEVRLIARNELSGLAVTGPVAAYLRDIAFR